MTVKLLTEQQLECVSLKGGCTGSSESKLVKMPHCWKSHVAGSNIESVYMRPVECQASMRCTQSHLSHHSSRIKNTENNKLGSLVQIAEQLFLKIDIS